jgi:hypothetical protein
VISENGFVFVVLVLKFNKTKGHKEKGNLQFLNVADY